MRKKNLILYVFIMIFANSYAQNTIEEGDYLIITFVKHGIEDIKSIYKRHDWVINVDSMRTSPFTIYPFRDDPYSFLEENIETLVYKHCKKIQTIKCYSKNGHKEKIHVYITPIHGKLVKWHNIFYETVSDVVYAPYILKDKERGINIYSYYNYVPFTKHEPFTMPNY